MGGAWEQESVGAWEHGSMEACLGWPSIVVGVGPRQHRCRWRVLSKTGKSRRQAQHAWTGTETEAALTFRQGVWQRALCKSKWDGCGRRAKVKRQRWIGLTTRSLSRTGRLGEGGGRGGCREWACTSSFFLAADCESENARHALGLGTPWALIARPGRWCGVDIVLRPVDQTSFI